MDARDSSPFVHLSDDLVEYIAAFEGVPSWKRFGELSLVSHQFNRVLRNSPLLWRRFSVKLGAMTEPVLEWICSLPGFQNHCVELYVSENIEQVALSSTRINATAIYELLFSKLNRPLQVLGISSASHLDASQFAQVISKIPPVHFDSLEEISFLSFKDCFEVPTEFLAKLRRLRELTLFRCNMVNNDAWKAFCMQSSPLLLGLSLMWVEGKVGECLLELSNYHTDALEYLKLTRLPSGVDHDVAIAVSKFPNVKQLTLESLDTLGSEDVRLMVSKCGQTLQTLELVKGRCIPERVLVECFQRCSALRALRISGHSFGKEAARQLGVHCSELKELELSFCNSLSDDALRELGRHGGVLDLDSLWLVHCTGITRGGVGDVLRGQKQTLHSLRLVGPADLTSPKELETMLTSVYSNSDRGALNTIYANSTLNASGAPAGDDAGAIDNFAGLQGLRLVPDNGQMPMAS